MTSAVSLPSPASPTFAGKAFDLFYVILMPIACIGIGYFAAQNVAMFELVLMLNMWVLGYHHVVATYTRIGFDRKSISEHRYEVVILPFLVIAAVISMIAFWGVWLVGTVYLHWQWYHYTRQSEGIAKSYLMKSGRHQEAQSEWRWFRIAFYVVSITPFLMVATRNTHNFLGYQVWMLPLNEILLKWFVAAYILAAVLMLGVAARWLLAKKTSVLHVAYLAGHVLIYGYAYGVCESLDQGWLALSMWHNAQYLLFVWMFNRKRFKGGVDSSHALVSYLSQPGRGGMYFLVTMLITVVIYGLLERVIAGLAAGFAFQATVVLYQVLNFHHYIVDARIWKLRRPDIKKTLDIAHV